MATKTWISTSSSSFTTAANWSDSGAPSNSDVLVFNGIGTANVAGVSTALTGLTIIVEDSYNGQIGSISGATSSYLVVDGGTAIIGRQTGSNGGGPDRVMLDFGSTAATTTVVATGSSPDDYPPVLVKGTALSVNQTGGSLGIAAVVGETANATVNVTKGAGSPSLYLGGGATIPTLTASGATILTASDQTSTTTTLSNGTTYTIIGSGVHTTLTVGAGATVKHNGSGNITTLNLQGTFDRTGDTRSITVSTTNVYSDSTLNLDNGKSGSTTFTTVNLVNCGMQNVTVSTPLGERW